MAGSQKGSRGSRNGTGAKRVAATERATERRPSEYARDAVSEWSQALRYAGAALRPTDRPRPKDRRNPKAKQGGRVGQAADALVSKLGAPGGLAAKLGMGHRIVERIRGGGQAAWNGGSASEDGGAGEHHMPIPIQESIEVALPVEAAYALCMRFEDYPEFIDRIDSVETLDDSTVAFEAKVRGVRRRFELEIIDELPNRRIDWEGTGDLEHSGVISFHPLAPSLTHIELTVDFDPQDLVQRLTRAAHVTERAIRADMHRFKAYAELWQEEDVDAAAEDDEAPDELDDEVEIEEEPQEEPDEYIEDEEESEPVEAG